MTLETSTKDPLGKLKKWKYDILNYFPVVEVAREQGKERLKNVILKEVMKKVPKTVEAGHHSPEG